MHMHSPIPPDGSVTLAKLAQEVLTRIDMHKFTPLSGSDNDANDILDTGIYFNIGGYGLQHARATITDGC